MRVVEPTRKQISFAGRVQCEQTRVTLARRRRRRIGEQIHLARKPRKRRHHGLARVILNDQLRDENRVGQVRKCVVEALPRVHAPQRVKIGFVVFAYEQ